jgi:hypothetical protein
MTLRVAMSLRVLGALGALPGLRLRCRCLASSVVVVVEPLRELCSRGKRSCGASNSVGRLSHSRRQGPGKSGDKDKLQRKASLAVFMFLHPPRRKTIRASQAPMPSAACCSLVRSRPFVRRPPLRPEYFCDWLRLCAPPTFLAQRIATKHTHRVPSGISPRFGRKSPDIGPHGSLFQQRTAIEARPRTTRALPPLFSVCTLSPSLSRRHGSRSWHLGDDMSPLATLPAVDGSTRAKRRRAESGCAGYRGSSRPVYGYAIASAPLGHTGRRRE